MHNSFHKLSFTKSCANAIKEFHRTLGGRLFRHEKMRHGGNVACPFISEYTIGLRPSSTIPQFKQTTMDSHMNCFINFAKNKQLKHINGEPKNQGEDHLLVGMGKSAKSGSKNAKMGT